MEVEIWKLRDQISELKGRPSQTHCATLIEVHNGMMNLKLHNGNYARKVYPQFARRTPTKPCDLPSFIKMNSDVEVRIVRSNGDVVFALGQVLTFLGKEDLVLKMYYDQSKVIVARKDCRIPSNMPSLNNYKEIDKLKKYTVSVETITPDNITEPSNSSINKEDPKGDFVKEESCTQSTLAHQETQTLIEEARLSEDEVDEQEDSERFMAISSMMNNYQQKMTSLSSELEMKLNDLSSDYRTLESKVMELLGKDWPPMGNLGGLNKSSRNSVESDERSFSQSGTPNPTPPPTVGFPQSLVPHGVFFPHQNQFGGFPGFVPLAPLGNTPYSRRQLGDKIFNVISQKYNSEEAMKMTEDLLTVLI